MTAKLVAYLAHPVSAIDRPGVEANLLNARVWLRWLVDNTAWAVSVPWMPYVEALPEDQYRERGLADDLVMLERHDMLILVGGRTSEGMSAERDHALDRGVYVVDWSEWTLPPPASSELFDMVTRHVRAWKEARR